MLYFIKEFSFKIPDTEGFGKFDIFATAFSLFTELVRLFYKKNSKTYGLKAIITCLKIEAFQIFYPVDNINGVL